MLEKAGHFNICHSISMCLYFVEITNIIQQSKGWNNPELYRTGATLALLLFAKTHCKKYIRIAFDVLVWWQTRSDTDKKLKDSFYFTKRIKGGKTILFDRFVEWINKEIRSYVRKYKKPNQELLMIRTSLLLKERLQQREEDAPASSRHKLRHCDTCITSKKDIAVSPIFCSQLCLISSYNFWATFLSVMIIMKN